MSHKKTGGTARNGRDSIGKRLGVKKYAGQKVIAGNIIVRQRGTTFHAGVGTALGSDYTVFAKVDGHVKFSKNRFGKKVISIVQ